MEILIIIIITIIIQFIYSIINVPITKTTQTYNIL